MPTLDEEMASLGFSPEGSLDSQMEKMGFELVPKPSLAKDTYHRAAGGLTTGILKSLSGVARWTSGAFKAQSALENAAAEKIGFRPDGGISEAIEKEFTGIADSLQATSQDAQAYSEANRDRSRDKYFTAQLAEAGGNFAGQITTSALGKVPGIISNVGQMFQQEYQAAKDKGADDLTAYTAGVANMPAAFLDYLSERNVVGGAAKKGAAAIAKRIATTFGIEGGTEVLQDEYSNWLAGNALKYDESRAIEERFAADNLPETGKAIATTFAIGGILGGGTTALLEAGRQDADTKADIAPQLEDLQKELDAIQAAPDESFNETQTQAETTAPITAPESSADVQSDLPETTGDTATETLPEVSRVRAKIDPVFAEHVANVYSIGQQENGRENVLAYMAENNLDPVDFGIEEAVAAPEIAPGAPVAVPEQVVTPSVSGEPVTPPDAIAAVTISPKLKAKVGVIDRAAKTITGGWTNAPEVVVVPNAAEVPENALTPEDRQAMKGNIDGLFGRDGKVYLVGSSVNTVQRAKEIILHESKGHYGLKGLFGDDVSAYDKAMKDAWTQFEARPALLNQIVKRGKFNSFRDLKQTYSHLDLATPEGKSAMAEELMARAAEIYLDPSKPRPTWFNSLVSRIKVALQKVMPSMKLTDQDIVGLLSTHQKKLLDRASDVVEQGPAASLSQEEVVAPASMTEGTGAFQGLEAALFSQGPAEDREKVENYDREDPDSWPLPQNLIEEGLKLVSEIEENPSNQRAKDTFSFLQNKADRVISILNERSPGDVQDKEAPKPVLSSEERLAKFRELPEAEQKRINDIREQFGKSPLFSASPDQTETPQFKEWFGDSKVVDENGNPLVVYHGSNRADRIGSRFRKDRATSGPMQYFTDNPEIASSYSEGKQDTSLETPDDYSGWFKFKGKGMRTPVSIDRAWWNISPEQRKEINEKIYTIGHENAYDASGPIVANSESIMGKDSIDYELRQAQGNGLKALVNIWLNSGSLFGNETEFMDVLKAAGMDMKQVEFDSPWKKVQGVFPVYLSIKNPLDVNNIPINVQESLAKAGARRRAKTPAGANSDGWDKNTISGKDWIATLEEDRKSGSSHAWTRIPDWATQELERLGYDGIKDVGGKLGGEKHGVWVPFEETQVKSALSNRGTFDSTNPDIRFSMTGHAQTDQILNDLNSKSEKAYTNLFDDFNALAVVEKGLNLGKRFNATMSAWTAALQTRQLANVMKGIFRNGMTTYNSSSGIFETAKDAKGLQAIFEPLTSQGLMDTWENYAKGKRAQTLVKQKLGVPWSAVSESEVKKLTGFTKSEAEQWIKEGAANPTVIQSHQDYQKHNEQLRDFALQTGLISPQQKKAMDELLDYVPFFREMDEEGGVRERGKSGLAGQNSGIKGFEGSERKILPLLESIAGQTSRIVDAGMKNIAAQRAVGVMQAAGVAERVPLATQPVSKNMAAITQDLSKLGVDFNRLPQSAKDHLTGLLYGPQKQTGAATSDPNVVPVKVNGKNQYYKTSDPALTAALQSLTKPEENFLMRVLGKGKALQTVTATTNPGFAIANLIRDTLSTFVQTGDTKHLFRVARGLVKAATNAPELQAIQATGSGGSAFLNVDPKNIRDVLKSDNFWKNRWQDKFFFKSVWDGWKQVLHAAENANRVAIYDKVIEAGGAPAEAAFQAQDTLNFQMHGASRSLQMLSAAVPFLNARMQGAYKIGRSFNEDPKGVALRGGMLMLGSLGLWALNHMDREDEDENGKNWYERLTNNDKALYWHMRVPGSSTIVRIPKPFEMGTLFATFPELMADTISDPKEARRSASIAGTSAAQAIPVLGDAVAGYVNSKEKSVGGKLGEGVFRSVVAGNPFVRTPLELLFNKNMFFNAPIITNKNAPAKAQFSDRTSATAKALGDATGGSPQQIDYAINSFLSGMTPYVLAVSDAIAKSAGYEGAPAKNAEDYIGAGRFVKDSKTMSNRYSQEFYQLRADAEDAVALMKWDAINATADEAQENAKNNQALLAMKKPIDAAEKELKAYKDQISRIRKSDLSNEEKRKQEDEVVVKRNEVFSRTMKYYQSALDAQKPKK